MTSSDFNPSEIKNVLDEAKQQTENFSELLDSLTTIDPKQKMLWKQIYDNAVLDRNNAYIAFVDLYIVVHGKEEYHFKHGQTLTKYLERMEKSNSQLLKLAELVAEAKEKEEEELIPSPNEIYSFSQTKSKK